MNRFREEKRKFLLDGLIEQFEKNAEEGDVARENHLAFLDAIEGLDMSKEAASVAGMRKMVERLANKGSAAIRLSKTSRGRKILKKKIAKWSKDNPHLIGIGAGSAGFGAGVAVAGD